MFKRFRRNSQLGILVLLGLTTSFTLALFGAYRLWSGDGAAAAIDLGMVALILAPVLYAMRSGNTGGAGAFLCAVNSMGCAAACLVIGPVALPWIYLVMMTNFFISGPRQALACNLLLVLAVMLMPGLFYSTLEGVSVAVTSALVTLFAYLFALRVSNDQLVLEEMASLDALTGLPNRRTMEHALADAVARNRGSAGTFGLLILDIDHFKEVNDSYGHAAGDAAIADLAAILKFEMRRQDRVFRFGGEEFVVLLRVDTPEGLWAASERLRLAVRNALRGPGGRITVSLGGAMAGDEERWQEWFSLADAALYRAKNNGRDSSFTSGFSDPVPAVAADDG